MASYALGDLEALILGSAAALCGVILGIRWYRPSTRAAALVAGVIGALVASTLATAPVTAWNIVSNTRTNARLPMGAGERLGAEEGGYDTSLTDRVRAIVPAGETYWLSHASSIDPSRAQMFRLWSLPAMLPRRAVSSARAADWIVTWGVPPQALGVPVDDVHVLQPHRGTGPPVYVGRVAR